MGGGGEDNAEGGTEGRGELQRGMGGDAGKKRPRSRITKRTQGEQGGGLDGAEAEAGQQKRVTRDVNGRRKYFFYKWLPMCSQGLEEALPGTGVRAELGCRALDVAIEENGGSIGKGMGQSGRRPDPAEAMSGEVQRSKK